MGGRGQSSMTSYQGKQYSVARGDKDVLEAVLAIEKDVAQHPKVAEGEEEALRQIRSIRSPDDIVTIYRAAPADHINTNDWVFLSESKADRFAHKTFEPTKMREGYKVLKAQVKASEVMWTDKNLEFAYVGKRKRGV